MKYVVCALISCVMLGGLLAAAPKADTLTLKDESTVSGTVLDITSKKVVIRVGKELKTIPRDEVTAIRRWVLEKTLAAYRTKAGELKSAGTVEDWKSLGAFCQKEQLLPERKRCLRQIVRLDPANAEARVELGHAQLDGLWLDEDEVAAKLAEGYEVVSAKLVKRPAGGGSKSGEDKPSEGKTKVRKEDPNPGYAVLPRTKMAPAQRDKMERERAQRLKAADKFLALKEEEYRGIDWSKRHIIPSKNFELHCNSTFNVARAYSKLMELIRNELSKMFRSENQRGNLKAPVFIYASQEEFINSDRLGRWMGRGLGGYYMPSNQSITTFHGTFGFTGTTFSVLCHEATHYYQGLVLKDFDNIPIWLIEGLAVYFGDGSTFDPKTEKITVGLIPRDRLAHIQEKMLLKRHSPVSKLISMTRGGREGFTGSHYADAWALIYFLVKSGSKGEKLMTDYWKIGLDTRLTKDHFVKLANEHFGGVEPLEKRYVEYILQLGMPPAGKVVGDYFVSDTFQFDFKAPGDDWEFFEDKTDKTMLVGCFKPGSAAEVRVYYTNNDTWAPASTYFEAFEKVARLKVKDFKHDPAKDRVKAGKLEWYRMTYQDEGRSEFNVSGELGGLGGFSLPFPDPDDERNAKDGEGKKKRTRDVTCFLLIQIDGVVRIECSTTAGEAGQYADLYDRMNENFTLCFARRW